MIERWEIGSVNRNGEHFQLSVKVDDRGGDGNGTIVAAVGPPRDGVVHVEVLIERNQSNAALITTVEKQISFYLLELDERNSWLYAQHNCGTASNAYSEVCWSYFADIQGSSKPDAGSVSSGPTLLETETEPGGLAVILPRFYERDMDILLAEEFRVSPEFAKWFLSATGSAAYQTGRVLEVEVSKSDNWGESDLVVLFESDDAKSRFALLIEDKINAPLQPEQLARYRLRAQRGQQRGLYTDFYVVLCSPKQYQDRHKDAEGFDAYVSYEDIATFLRKNDPAGKRNLYRAGIFATAATKLGHPTPTTYGPETDAFWKAAYEIAEREFHDLEMKPTRFASGTAWISFRPLEFPRQPIAVIVDLKGRNGFADLTFSGVLCRLFGPLISSILEADMTSHQTGRSTAIRLNIPSFGVSTFDSAVEEHVRTGFGACTRLIRFYRQHRLSLDLAASKSLIEPDAPGFTPQLL